MFEEFTGLHSEVCEGNVALPSQDLKASSSAITSEKRGAPFLLLFTKLQQETEGPSIPRICRRLLATLAASTGSVGPG